MYYLKNSKICFVRKFGISCGMKCPVFGNVIPVTLFATHGSRPGRGGGTSNGAA